MSESNQTIKCVQHIPPEDLRPGDYVAISHEAIELLRCGDLQWQEQVETIRVMMLAYGAGRPLKVVDICVPFVLVKTPHGTHDTLDLRQQRIVRLPRTYGKSAFKRYRDETGNV